MYTASIMKNKLQVMTLCLAFLVCILPLNTQAEINAPMPGKKPANFAFPLPAKKPVFSNKKPKAEVSVSYGIPVPDIKPNIQVSTKTQSSDPIDPISKQQAEIYNRIFAYQANGDIDKADNELRNIIDERLLGHVLFQRYMHPTAYKTSFEELKYWLDMYADHPGADKIYKLALSRKPDNFSAKINEPEKFRSLRRFREPTVEKAKYYKSTIKRNPAQKQEYKSLQRAIRKHIRAGAPSYALKSLNTSSVRKFIDDVEEDRLKASIAASYFYAKEDLKALNLAREVVERSGPKAPFASWIGGLASWKLEKYDQASEFFAVAVESEYASGWERSANAFWAARSNMRTGNVKNVSHWLHQAYEHPHTFYGLLAGRALGYDHEFNWDMPAFTRKYFQILNQDPKGRRAIALVAAGQPHLAEIELSYIEADQKPELYKALLSYATFADLPALSYRLGGVLPKNGDLYNTALYPKSPWKPSNGFQVDPALIHAIMRQESRFNPLAENQYSGAAGLMQLMPATASYIAGKNFKGSARHQLKNPQINLDIGQKYLQYLLKNSLVDGDIIKLLVAYNAGPGNLQKWTRKIGKDVDPLIFVEMIPVKETRDYVEHVLSNYWIYRLRDDKNTNTLDILAQGKWPSYLELQKVREYDIAIRD